MINALMKGIFWLINSVANVVLSPILGLLNLFPTQSIQGPVSSLINLYTFMIKYILLVVDLLCIPRYILYAFFLIIIGILSWVVSVRTYLFVMAIYRHFKP